MYNISNYKKINLNFSNWLFTFSNGKKGLVLLGFWAFIEPSFWFIAADMPLILYSFFAYKKYIKFFLYTIIFAIIGVIFSYFLHLIAFDKMHEILLVTPFVPSEAIMKINDTYDQYGYWGLLWQSFSFMSVKIWISLAVAREYSMPLFVILTGISRAIRFFIVALISMLFGKYFGKYFQKHSILFTALYLIGFIVMLILVE